MAYNIVLPGNDFFRTEFHYSMPFVLFGIAMNNNSVLIFLIYVFSALYLLYGTFDQLGILQSNVEWFFDNSSIASINQEEVWGYLYAATMRWLSTSLFCAIVIRLWWRDDFRSFVTWRSLNILSLVCTLNAFTAVLSPSIIEFWLLTKFTNDDWGVFGYFLIAVVSRFLFALYQGHLYVFDRTKSDTATYILTGASNGILMITNTIFIYSVLSAYWRIAIKLPYLQVWILTIVSVSLIVASIDIVYRLILLKWCAEKVVSGKNFTIVASPQGGIQNTEALPQEIPIYRPSWHLEHLNGAGHDHALVPNYEIILIDRHRLRFLAMGRPYNNFRLIFIPPDIIVFVPDQPPIYQNHDHVAVEEIIIHNIHGYRHINQLVDSAQN